jgi:membrane-bound lytic murein transglycosylase B
MGLGQFMPSSWRRWGVDFDGDRHIDLIGNASDAIGSVAHYLQEHGWTRDQPTHFAVEPPADAAERARLLAPDIEPRWTLDDLAALNLSEAQQAQVARHGPWALVLLENGETAPPTHVAATRNFWVVTRYNRSSYYALAVIELGERLRQLREAG